MIDERTRAQAEFIGLSPRTLHDHKRDGRPLSKPATKLLDLLNRHQIIPNNGRWSGFEFCPRGERLFCDNNESLTPAEAGQYTWVLKMLHGAHRELRASKARIQELERQNELLQNGVREDCSPRLIR